MRGFWTPEQIKALRLQRQMTQEELAHHLRVTFSTVNRWENGKSRPSHLAAHALDTLALASANVAQCLSAHDMPGGTKNERELARMAAIDAANGALTRGNT